MRRSWTEADLAPYLAMAYAPEPDLFIRTGGEQRISNFLLWQLAYTELYFTEPAVARFRRRGTRCGHRLLSPAANAASAAPASSCSRRRRPRADDAVSRRPQDA